MTARQFSLIGLLIAASQPADSPAPAAASQDRTGGCLNRLARACGPAGAGLVMRP